MECCFLALVLNMEDREGSRIVMAAGVGGHYMSPSIQRIIRIIRRIVKNISYIPYAHFISLVASCVGLREEEPQTAHPMSFTTASHIAANVLMGHYTLPNQSHWCFIFPDTSPLVIVSKFHIMVENDTITPLPLN